MPIPRVARPRLAVLLTSVAAVAATLVGVVAPASAADDAIVITPSVKQAVVGTPFDVAWTSGPDVVSLTASGDWADPVPTDLSGMQTITPRAEGDQTFTLTGQVAGGGQPVTTTVIVPVDAAPTEVTAVAPTYPDACNLTIPQVEGVDYVVTLGGESEVLDPDTYPTVFFGDEALGADVQLVVRAQDGFALAPDSPTRFDVRVDPSCEPRSTDLVRTTAACRTVSFTSVTDEPLTVLYGDADREDEDGRVRLAPRASRTVDVTRSVLAYAAFNDAALVLTGDDEGISLPPGVRFDSGEVRVRLACGHPTVAPAAGR